MRYDPWETEPTPGWQVAFQIVPCRPLYPVRVEGRWRRPLCRHFVLQAMYLNENPPSPWITVRRAFDPDVLADHIAQRRQREALRHSTHHH